MRSIANKLGVHRRLVRQALSSAVPPERRVVCKPAPRLDPVKAFIEEMLVADQTAPRKQRHSAHRIWVRLCQETPALPVAESTVRAYVRERKQALGLVHRETYVVQCYQWAQEAQVDWYEAYVVLDAEQVKVQVFVMRSMKSGAAFHRAYLRATQQAFFEAHELGFAYFGGVFKTLRYDNLSSAVKKVFRGHTREEHTRFIEFRSHWRFEAQFCSPRQPHEKGGVEVEGGTYRRNHLVPVPKVRDLCALNLHLLSACTADEGRMIGDRSDTVGAIMVVEREHLLALPKERFDVAESGPCVIDGKGCVLTHANWYSTPLGAGTRALVRVLPSEVEVWHAGRPVARHERSYGRGQQILDLEHYLDVLVKKPGALPGSMALAQCRAQGRWPKSFDRLW
ncbi:MAG: IS21 family transposase, partial [Candidatus Dormibacteria bacterium]